MVEFLVDLTDFVWTLLILERINVKMVYRNGIEWPNQNVRENEEVNADAIKAI